MPPSSARVHPASASAWPTSGSTRSDDAVPAFSRKANARFPSDAHTDSQSVELSMATILIAAFYRGPDRRRVQSAPSLMIELTIESLDQEGRGVAHAEGKVVFVEGALPGEAVSAEVVRRKPSFEL